MSKIERIREWRWTNRDGKPEYRYDVHYQSGRNYCYDETQTLPMSVLMFLLSDKVNVEIKYGEFEGRGVKVVRYTI